VVALVYFVEVDEVRLATLVLLISFLLFYAFGVASRWW
jgi:hypothetical protein